MKFPRAIRDGFIGAKSWFLMASPVKKIIIVIIFGIVLFLITSPLRGNNKQQFTTAPITRETVTDIVSESGNMEAPGQAEVYSTSTGMITELYFKDGESVKAGQKLFAVQSTATPEEKAVAYAAYQSSATAYNQALNTYRDKQATAQKIEDDVKGHDSDETFAQKATRTTAQAARDSAYDATISAEAALKSAELAYKATQNAAVVAPISGIIGNLSSKVGDKVNAKTVTGSIPVLVIGNTRNLSIVIDINEVDRPKIKLDQNATVGLIAIKDKTFEGRVTAIDDYGTNTNGVVTYKVTLQIDDADPEIMPGMTANVEIEANKHENVLTVPNSAVKAYQGGKAVQVLDKNNKPEFIPVKTGLKGSTRTEIIEGVTEGMQVITSSPQPSSGGGLFGGG